MKKITCNDCGAELVLAERGETVTRGETPLEHMNETGHTPRGPTTYRCNDCGNVWPYSGDADRVTCPNCRGKNTQPADE